MKPPEILGLLEEAAGTKMYETKKQAAMRTLEKKQVKVDEINKARNLTRKWLGIVVRYNNRKVLYLKVADCNAGVV
jgi:structural maintenance of chromosome 2